MRISKRLLALFLVSALTVSTSISVSAENMNGTFDNVSEVAYVAENSEYESTDNFDLSNTSSEITANVGETVSLNSESNNSVWKSSNNKIARVDKKGSVQCLSVGECTIINECSDGEDAYYRINVKQPVTSVKMKSVAYMSVGSTTEISNTVTVSPSDATNKDIEWQSSNENVAVVNENGTVEAKGAGSCQIIARSKDDYDKKASCNVIVSQPVTSVAVSSKSIVLNNGEVRKLSAQVTPSNATSKCVSWQSTNKNVATVSASGVVTATGAGTCIIKAVSTDGSNKYGYCSVMVTQNVTDFTFVNAPEKLNVGEKQSLTTVVTPSYATTKLVKWSSSDTNVATVSARGVVTAKNQGECTITATTTDGSNISKSFTLTVNQPVTNIELDENKKIVQEGKSTYIKTTVTPSNATNRTLVYVSSNTNIATVSSSGVVYGRNKGTCAIYVSTKDGSYLRKSCIVNVVRPVTDLSFEENEVSCYTDENIQLNPVITPADASNLDVTYESSDTSIAVVDNNGVVKGISKGSCTITCISSDNSKIYDVCKVNIKQNVSSISIFGDSKIKEGNTTILTAKVSPTNADNKNVSWSSSDSKIATVDSNGNVKAISAGEVTIICTSDENDKISASKKIIVQPVKTEGELIADYASQWVGITPYVWGGTSLQYGADCSGFVCSVYQHFGYNLWYARVNLDTVGRSVSLSEAKPGDIVLFPGHVAIYAGDGKVTHALNERLGVMTTDISWGGYVRCVRRVVD